MTSSEGSRPSIETVSVKEVITKVDLNRDGVLAASSARKLDKAGYLLQERTALVAPRAPAEAWTSRLPSLTCSCRRKGLPPLPPRSCFR